MWQGQAQSQRRCGRGGPSPGADVAGKSPVPGADVAVVHAALLHLPSGRAAVHSLRPQAWTHLHTGKEATDTDLKSVLAGLSGLYIRGAYYIGAEERTTGCGGRPDYPPSRLGTFTKSAWDGVRVHKRALPRVERHAICNMARVVPYAT